MKNFALAALLLAFGSASAQGTSAETRHLNVTVDNPVENPVRVQVLGPSTEGKVSVSIDGYNPFDSKGTYDITLDSDLSRPIRVEVLENGTRAMWIKVKVVKVDANKSTLLEPELLINVLRVVSVKGVDKTKLPDFSKK